MSVVSEGQVVEAVAVAPVVTKMSLSDYYPSLDDDGGVGEEITPPTESTVVAETPNTEVTPDKDLSWWAEDSTVTPVVEGKEVAPPVPQIQPVLTQIGEKLGFGDTSFESVDAIVEAINVRLAAEQQVPVNDKLVLLNDIVALPDEDLLFHEFKAYGDENPLMAFTDSEIEEKIESLRDAGRLESIAEQYRGKRKGEIKGIEQQRHQEVEAKNKEMVEYRHSIEQAIPKFMPDANVQLSAKQVDELKRFVLSGEFGNLLASDPSAIVRAAFDLHEMGKQYQRVKAGKQLAKGKSEVYKSLESGEPRVGTTDSTNNQTKTVVKKTLSEYYGL
jgi:hypothetical protein